MRWAGGVGVRMHAPTLVVRGRRGLPSSFHLLKSVWHSITTSGCDPSSGMRRVRCTSARECVFAQNWLRMKGAMGVIERAILLPPSLQHVSASAWKQLSPIYFFVCAKHILNHFGTQAQCFALRSPFSHESLESSQGSCLNCPESRLKEGVWLKMKSKFDCFFCFFFNGKRKDTLPISGSFNPKFQPYFAKFTIRKKHNKINTLKSPEIHQSLNQLSFTKHQLTFKGIQTN